MSTESMTEGQTSLVYATPTLIGPLPGLPNFPPTYESNNYCSFAPLIDAKPVTGGTLIRVTLLIDSSVSSVSVPLTVPPNNTPSNPVLVTDANNVSTLSYYLEYQSTGTPTGIINLWYLELFYNSNVNNVQVFLWDADPELSRGTETTVQPA